MSAPSEDDPRVPDHVREAVARLLGTIPEGVPQDAA